MSRDTFLQKDTYMSNTSRGLISGFIGGLAGTAVKTLIEQFLPVRKIEQKSAQLKIVDDLSTKITGTPISIENKALAEQLVSFPFGASIGAAYGYAKKDKLVISIADGVIFGATTWVSTHETSLPLVGLESKPTEIPLKLQANELFAHIAFGITTEFVRSLINGRMKRS
jgi:putative membrane protein